MTPDVRLLDVHADVLGLLACWDLVAAGRALGMPVPPDLLDDQWVWASFAARSRRHPEHARWYAQQLVVEDGRVVGHVRLHEPPDATGTTTAGWSVLAGERRRGVATAAVRLLLARAREEGVRVVVARVAPGNVASLGVARALGFVDVGEQDHPMLGVPMRRLEWRPSPVAP